MSVCQSSSGWVRWRSFWGDRQRGCREILEMGREEGGRERVLGGGRRWIKRGRECDSPLWGVLERSWVIGDQGSSARCRRDHYQLFVQRWRCLESLLLLSWASGRCCYPSSWCLWAGPEEPSSQGWVRGFRLCCTLLSHFCSIILITFIRFMFSQFLEEFLITLNQELLRFE